MKLRISLYLENIIPSHVKQQFFEIRKKARTSVRKTQNGKEKVSDVKFITTYNPDLPIIKKIIKNSLYIVHTDEKMKKIFPRNIIKPFSRRKSIFKETLSPSLFPSKAERIENSITSCNKCDIYKIFFFSHNKFKCKVTGRIYNIRGKLTCNKSIAVYLMSGSNCDDQYVGSVLGFQRRFKIHKSDIKTKKDRCGTARHLNNKCTESSNPHKFLKTRIIESVRCD